MTKPFWVLVNHQAEGFFATSDEAEKFADKFRTANPTFEVVVVQQK